MEGLLTLSEIGRKKVLCYIACTLAGQESSIEPFTCTTPELLYTKTAFLVHREDEVAVFKLSFPGVDLEFSGEYGVLDRSPYLCNLT
jgi:hypothetical protein